MSRLSQIGRTFISCVGRSKTLDDDVAINGRPNTRAKEEDKQELIDPPLSTEFYERVQRDAVAEEDKQELIDLPLSTEFYERDGVSEEDKQELIDLPLSTERVQRDAVSEEDKQELIDLPLSTEFYERVQRDAVSEEDKQELIDLPLSTEFYERVQRDAVSEEDKQELIDLPLSTEIYERVQRDAVSEEDKQELIDLPLSTEFYERVQRDAIAVEFLDRTKNGIVGYVSVRNDAPEKQVYVRYTTDSWTTQKDIAAEWQASTDDRSCDKYIFSIPNLETPYIAHLAVGYEVLGQQYWDNNNSKNYEVKQ